MADIIVSAKVGCLTISRRLDICWRGIAFVKYLRAFSYYGALSCVVASGWRVVEAIKRIVL